MKINVGTYNVWHCQNYAKHREGVFEMCPDQIAQHVIDNDIAIFGMEEVDANCKRSKFLDTPAYIADFLTEKTGVKHYWAYATTVENYSNPGSKYGNALISRYPIKEVRKVLIDVGMGVKMYYEPRSLLIADVEVEGKMMTVIVTHFGLRLSEQQLAVENLQMVVKDCQNPVIFMGDLNTRPGSIIYNQVAEILKDTCDGKEEPLTIDSFAPSIKIDYIFTSESIPTENTHIDDIRWSDHLPLTTTIEW